MGKDYDSYLGTCRADVFGERVIERFKRWTTEIDKNGLRDVWRRNYRQYHNAAAEASSDKGWGWDDSFSIQGENGEVLGVRINECRNLITNALNLTYAKPIGLKAVAKTSDPTALAAAKIADATLAEDFKASGGGKAMRNLGEIALTVTTGFGDPEWDTFAGEAYVPSDDGSSSYAGAPKISERWPDEVCFDLTKRRWEDVEQVIVVQRANRFLLESQFPDHSEEILNQPSLNDSELCSLRYQDEDTDDIAIARFVHRNGNSRFLPAGRLGLVLENGKVLRDGDNPYSIIDGGRLGITPITAASGMGSVYGYPIMNDLSPLQQWLNLVATMIATLIAGYGAPNIAGPILQQLDIQQMVGGGRYFGMKGQGEVKALNLLPDMKPLFELLQAISAFGEKLSGMNSVVRGGAEQDMSGKAVALWKSMAIQFMSSFMQSSIEQHETLGTYLIQLREKFSTGEQTAEIVGENNAAEIKRYRASDTFKHVSKVRAEAVDPAAMTLEGREERAQFLMQQGMFTSPQEYLTMVKTGRDEPLYRAPMAQLMLIQRENDSLMKGEDPIVLEDDAHDVHGPEHSGLLAEPAARENPDITQAILNHKAKHMLFLMGIAPLQGIDPETSQPYPPATEQFAQAKAQQQMAEQQAMAAQSMTGAPQGGEPSQTQAPAPQGPPPQQQEVATLQDKMQESAMGPVQ